MREEVDLVIKDTDVLTANDRKPVIRNTDIAIDGGYIRAIGKLTDYEGVEEIRGKGKVAMPGFVDCHTHP
ncbi:MAG: hypothetical protein QW837_07775, partial [Conexivisphaerales archaeon]